MDQGTASLIEATPLFAELGEAARARLAAASRMVRLAPSQVVFSQGDRSDAVYVVAEGKVTVGTVSEAGHVTHLADLGPGEVLGELAVVDGGRRSAGATARTGARVLRIDGAAFVATLREEAELALALLRDVAGKLRAADAQIEARGAMSLGARLTAFLRTEAEDGEVALTQSQIAERMGVSREAVNRQLRPLVAAGTIALRRGRVVIVAADAL